MTRGTLLQGRTLKGPGSPLLPSSVVSASSWVDLCRPPYSVTPGTDITSALQSTINAANTANQDTTIYFSTPGVYFINGALQSGSGTISGQAYSYNGQVVFPSRPYTSGSITIRIMGLTPVANFPTLSGVEPPMAGGVVLLSNATSGWVFDAIASTYFAGTNAVPSTAIRVVFENIVVRCPVNPQCGGINGYSLATLRFAGSCSVDTQMTGNSPGALTGTAIGIQFPPYDNQTVCRQDGDLGVLGFPVGIAHSEHFLAEDLRVAYCLVGIQPQGATFTGHSSLYKSLILPGCKVGIQPAGSSQVQIDGMADIGDIAGGFYHLLWAVNDPNNLLYGHLKVSQWTGDVPSAWGFPVNGAQNVRFEPYVGRPSEWPSDDFTRNPNVASTSYLGATSNTHHVWIPADAGSQSDWQSGGGVLKKLGTGPRYAVIKHCIGRSRRSRVVQVIASPVGAGYSLSLLIGYVNSGSNAGNRLIVNLSGSGVVGLYKFIGGTWTTLATSANSTVAAGGGPYTVTAVISNPPQGGNPAITVYVGTTAVLVNIGADATGIGTLSGGTYTLSAAEAAQFTDTDLLNTADGIHLGDANSTISRFAVMPT